MANRTIDPQIAGPKLWHDGSKEISLLNPEIPQGNPNDERSGLDITRASDLKTEPMRRRDVLRAQAVAAAAKAGNGYRNFATPNQPDDFGVPLTDGFGYSC